ncbi:MAG: hypothetical protein WCJ62_05090 [Flavobacterium sp.]
MKLILSILVILNISCSPKKEVVQNSREKLLEQSLISEPPVLVYKTKRNYNNLVPILLSDDGKTIISYPHPKDLIVGSGYPLPTILNDGYLIDNRGIGRNVAFLSITYEEYSKLENVPSIEELYKLIIDKDPLIELCNCGTKTNFTNIEKEINYMILNNKLKTICKLIK